jgi:hypothetical protein
MWDQRSLSMLFTLPDGYLIEEEKVPQVLFRCETRNEALRLICDIAEEAAAGASAGTTIVHPDGKTIAEGFFPSLSPHFSSGLRLLPAVPPFVGTCAEAIYERTIVTCTNIANDNRYDAGWRQLCLGAGINSVQSVPVFIPEKRRAVGTFVMAFRETHEVAHWKMSTMTPLARWTGTVLDRYK